MAEQQRRDLGRGERRSADADVEAAVEELVREDLPRLDQEHDAGGGQCDMVGAALHEANAELAFQPLHLLAQRRLDDALPFDRPPEV